MYIVCRTNNWQNYQESFEFENILDLAEYVEEWSGDSGNWFDIMDEDTDKNIAVEDVLAYLYARKQLDYTSPYGAMVKGYDKKHRVEKFITKVGSVEVDYYVLGGYIDTFLKMLKALHKVLDIKNIEIYKDINSYHLEDIKRLVYCGQ